MKFFRKFKQTGSSLLEILVATTVVAITLVAIVGVTMYSVSHTAQIRYQEQAGDLSQELIEIFFKERALLGWNTFAAKMSSANRFCTSDPSQPIEAELIGCSDDDDINLNGSIFHRHGEIEENVRVGDDQHVTVKVITTWDGGKMGMRSSTLVHQFRRIN